MEPMVVCALGIVVYCGYLTVKDILADLHQEGFLVKPKLRERSEGIFGGTLRRFFSTKIRLRSRIVPHASNCQRAYLQVDHRDDNLANTLIYRPVFPRATAQPPRDIRGFYINLFCC